MVEDLRTWKSEKGAEGNPKVSESKCSERYTLSESGLSCTMCLELNNRWKEQNCPQPHRLR